MKNLYNKNKDTISIIIPVDPRRKIEALNSIKKQKIKCIPIVEKESSASVNRNRGAKRVKTKWAAYINMHTLLADDWSEKALEFLKKHPEIDMVGGPHLNPKEETFFGKISGYALGSIFGSAISSFRYNVKRETLNADERHLTGANLIFKSEVLKKVQFDERLYPGEDPNFIKDAKKEGFKVAYSPDIIVFQRRRDNLKDFAKQIYYYGTARPNKERFSETLKMPSYLIPPFFLIYLILMPFLLIIHKGFLIPLILYLSLNISFSAYEGVKRKDLLTMFLLPFIFLVIHLSYGAGFLIGTITGKIK